MLQNSMLYFGKQKKKETIKKEITKTKFGLETNKDEMYYSVFENGSRKEKCLKFF